MKPILFLLSLLFALSVPALAQPSLCTVTGVLYRPSGAACVSCTLQITKARKGGVVLTDRVVTITSDGEGDVSFTAVRGSLTTIKGNFRIGGYDFTPGIDMYIPDTATADLEDLQSAEDALSALVGGGGGGDVASVFGRTGVVVAASGDYTWAQINKTTSSIADITTRSASDLSSGTLPDARFPATLPAASGVNLTALNASNLGSGTVPLARISGLTNTEIDAAAAIALSKLATLTASRAVVLDGSGVLSASAVTSTELGYVGGVTSAIQTQLDARALGARVLTAGVGLTGGGDLTADRTFTLDLSELTDNQVLWSGASASRTITFSLSGASDPVLTLGDGVFNVSTGTIQQGGTAVSLTGHAHAAADITSGVIATARLGTGTADNTVFLRGDGTWAAAGGGSPPGSDTQFIYNNAGAFGASSMFTLNSSAVTMTRAGIGTTSTDGIILTNTTAAAAGAQQYSPRTVWTGQGWKTDATAASQTVSFSAETIPVQGAANPSGTWSLKSSINGGAYTERFAVTSAGAVTAASFTASGLTSTRVPFAGTAGLLGDDSGLVFATATDVLSIGGVQSMLNTGEAGLTIGGASPALRIGQFQFLNNATNTLYLQISGASVLNISTAGAFLFQTTTTTFNSASAAAVPVTVQAAASPSANQFEWKNSSGTVQLAVTKDWEIKLRSVAFSALPTVANGALIYCSDCTIASPCASGGSGAFAKGINSAWVCN